jgi:mxaL protein
VRHWLWQKGWRFWSTVLAGILITSGAFHPTAQIKREVFRYLFVLDITQSMNTQDVRLDGVAIDRLGYAKAAVRNALLSLPCGSEAGLGLFTTRNTQILFEPIEVCAHLPIIDDVLSHIDWRMAWAADSHIAEGVFSALRQLRSRAVPIDLAFFTDGQQTPEAVVQPNFGGKPGEQRGLLIGIGGLQPVAIPKLDRNNQLIGYWEIGEVRAPVSTTAYQNAPAEAAAPLQPTNGPYLSHLFEDRLRQLAVTTGLDYVRLTDFAALNRALQSDARAETRRVATDLSPWLALAGGVLLLASFAPSRRMPPARHANHPTSRTANMHRLVRWVGFAAR